jgi:rubredoxin
MSDYSCAKCSHTYRPEEGDLKHGIGPGTHWSDLPPDWVCPDCGAPKFEFTNFGGGTGEGSGWTVT